MKRYTANFFIVLGLVIFVRLVLRSNPLPQAIPVTDIRYATPVVLTIDAVALDETAVTETYVPVIYTNADTSQRTAVERVTLTVRNQPAEVATDALVPSTCTANFDTALRHFTASVNWFYDGTAVYRAQAVPNSLSLKAAWPFEALNTLDGYLPTAVPLATFTTRANFRYPLLGLRYAHEIHWTLTPQGTCAAIGTITQY